MTLLISIMILIGLTLKLDFYRQMKVFLKEEDLFNDLLLVFVIGSSFYFGDLGSPMLAAVVPMVLFFQRYFEEQSVESNLLSLILFLLFPAAILLDVSLNIPTIMCSIFALGYSIQKGIKEAIFGSVINVFFWLLVIKFNSYEIVTIFLPLIFLHNARLGFKTKSYFPLELSFLLISYSSASQLVSFPEWFKSIFLLCFFLILFFTKAKTMTLMKWSVLLLPCTLLGKSANLMQVFMFLAVPIIQTVFSLAVEEIKNFKVKSSNEVVLTYRQIAVLLLLIFTLGGFRGTILNFIFPETFSFSFVIFFVFITLFLPLKEYLLNNEFQFVNKNHEVYYTVRSVLVFLGLLGIGGIWSTDFNFFSLGLLLFILGLGFLLSAKPSVNELFKLYQQRLEISISQFSTASMFNSPKNGQKPKLPILNISRWDGYNNSIEISFIFLCLLLLIFVEGQ